MHDFYVVAIENDDVYGKVEERTALIVLPVGGATEPIIPLALLWPWVALVVIVATGAIAAVALKRRMA